MKISDKFKKKKKNFHKIFFIKILFNSNFFIATLLYDKGPAVDLRRFLNSPLEMSVLSQACLAHDSQMQSSKLCPEPAKRYQQISQSK